MISKKRTSWVTTGALVAAALATAVTVAGPAAPASAATTYTMTQVKAHRSATNCWSVVSGKVFNLTTWVNKHPGGSGVIVAMCGKDSTSAFKAKHGLSGIEATMLGGYKIATLAKAKVTGKVKPKVKPKVSVKPSTSPKPVIYGDVSAAAVVNHKATTDCWTIINANIYDLTAWIPKHPGGPAVIKALCGIDASAAFFGAHGAMGQPVKALGAYLIGTVMSSPGSSPKPSTSDTATASTLTIAEVAKHGTAADCWSVINGNVYDLSGWVTKHPGGSGVILALCGHDGSAAFNGYHGAAKNPAAMLATYLKGAVGTVPGSASPSPSASATPSPTGAGAGGGSLTVAAVALHASASDCWAIINGNVYNLSSWVNNHPGGSGVITAICGKDGSAAFNGYTHSNQTVANSTLAGFMLGSLGGGGVTPTPSPTVTPTPSVTPTPTATGGAYTAATVATHATAGDCWAIINGNVYNLTSWVNAHPGGSGVITAICGKDGSAAFNGYTHSNQTVANSTLAGFKIGTLTGGVTPTPSPTTTPTVTPTPTPTATGVAYTAAQVATHATAANCWAIINGNVYNLTTWVTSHPGGSAVITAICGTDGSAAFNGYTHSNQTIANSTLAGFLIGTLSGPAPTPTPTTTPTVTPTPSPTGAGTNGETLTVAIVATHATAANCWAIINNNVYDLTNWVNNHPGGTAVITAICGKDGSAAFNGYTHSNQTVANSTLAGFKIGTLGSPATIGTPPPAPTPVATVYTSTQVKAHATATSCWSAINLTVYDLTGWINLHPGGKAVILAACGRNASSVYTNKHGSSASVALQMKGYAIGVITSTEQAKLTTAIKP